MNSYIDGYIHSKDEFTEYIRDFDTYMKQFRHCMSLDDFLAVESEFYNKKVEEMRVS